MNTQRKASTIAAAFVVIASGCWQAQQAFAFSSSKSCSTKIISFPVASSTSSLYAVNGNNERDLSRPFADSSPPNLKRDLTVRSYFMAEAVVESTNDTTTADEESNKMLLEQNQDSVNSISVKVSEMSGTFDEKRLVFPELASGEVPRVFSNISYKKSNENGNIISQALHAPGSVLGAAALVSGTTIGAGVLALPTATAPAGLLPSSVALCIAWFYMTMSGLLIAELAINRIGETGNPGVGLLDLYKTFLNKELAWIGSATFLFLHYTVLVAYMSQGGSNLGALFTDVGLGPLASIHGLDQVIFAAAVGSLVYFAKPSQVENVNNTLVIAVIATFVAIIGAGAETADFPALIAPVNQHPEMIATAFPICFLSMVFHNVVPTVVTQLEGDKKKITQSLIIGTSIPLVMFLAWNAIILGNIITIPDALGSGLDPIQMLQNEGIGGERLGQLVSGFSELAITTSLIGFIYGLLDALTDLFGLPLKGPKFEQWKPALFAGLFVPPLLFSLGNPDIFFKALDYGGAFGVSTLFLVLPPIMVYNQRYGDNESPVTVPPMVPFGKIPLASLWKAAGTLIVEQGADKLGIVDFVKDVWSKFAPLS